MRSRRTFAGHRSALGAGTAAVVVAGLAVGFGLAGNRAGARASLPCAERARGATIASVKPDAGLNNLWAKAVATNKGWTDGDSVYAYAAPGLGTLWSFADSYVGGLVRGGRRLPGIYHNLLVVSHGHSFRVLTGPDDSPIVGPRNGPTFYLSAGGIVAGRSFQEFLVREVRTGPGSLDIRPVETVLARFELPGLERAGVTAVPGNPAGVTWGAYVLRAGGFTYVYGASARPLRKAAFVARVSGTDLHAPWSYWDGRGWSAKAAMAAPLAADVGQEFSVTPYDGLYVLVTTDGSQPFSAYAELRFSCSPVGPFGDTHRFLVSPLVFTAGAGAWHDANVYVYDELAQPALSRPGHLVVSYDRNSLDFPAVLADAAIYRPTYLDLQLRVPPRA